MHALAIVSVLLICLPLAACSEQNVQIESFSSDGCSAWPDGTLDQKELWLRCCTVHDYAYWKGGTAGEREQADIALEQCVAEAGEPEIATVMLAGVRVGGSPWWPTGFRWGYGWPWPRGYGALTTHELEQVRRASAQATVPR